MAPKVFHIDVMSPDKMIYSGLAQSLVAPCTFGYLGVLADHAPLVANVVSGKIALKKETGELLEIACATSGFLEVIKNKATLLLV